MRTALELTRMGTSAANVLAWTVRNALSGFEIRKTERKIAMKIISPSAHLLTTPDYKNVLSLIKTCYKSEDKISEGSAFRTVEQPEKSKLL